MVARSKWNAIAVGLFTAAVSEERAEVEQRGVDGFSEPRWIDALLAVWRGAADDWGVEVEEMIAGSKALSDEPGFFERLKQIVITKAFEIVRVSEAEWDDLGEGVWDPGRISTMATTESVQALGFAQHEVAVQANLQMFKVWQAVVDERTRPTHLEANGQRQLLNDPFEVGGALLQWPADAGGPLSEIINCRCWEDYELAAVA